MNNVFSYSSKTNSSFPVRVIITFQINLFPPLSLCSCCLPPVKYLTHDYLPIYSSRPFPTPIPPLTRERKRPYSLCHDSLAASEGHVNDTFPIIRSPEDTCLLFQGGLLRNVFTLRMRRFIFSGQRTLVHFTFLLP